VSVAFLLWEQWSGLCVLLAMFELFAICLQFVRSFVHRGGLLVLLHVVGF
jgi:hypothetical protein